MGKSVSSYKLQKENSGDNDIPKIWNFLLRNRILFKVLY